MSNSVMLIAFRRCRPDAAGNHRGDAAIHLPLTTPGFWTTGITPPAPTSVPMDEASLRQRLAQAIEASHEAQAALDQATAAHRRSVELVAQRQAELASFEGIEAVVTQVTVAGLRDTICRRSCRTSRLPASVRGKPWSLPRQLSR